MQKKLNKNDYIFRNFENQTLTKLPGSISGQSFLLKNLTNCQVYLCDYISQIYIQNCQDCEIYTGPVESSIFMRKSKNTKLTTAGQQIRISDSSNIQSFLFSLTDLTLENASEISIAPYNFVYKQVGEHFEKLGFDLKKDNNAFRVFDFTPKEGNFFVMDCEKFEGNFFFGEGEDIMVNPVPWPIYFGGDLDFDVFNRKEEKGAEEEGMMTFDIKVGMEKAQEIVDGKNKEDFGNEGFDSRVVDNKLENIEGNNLENIVDCNLENVGDNNLENVNNKDLLGNNFSSEIQKINDGGNNFENENVDGGNYDFFENDNNNISEVRDDNINKQSFNDNGNYDNLINTDYNTEVGKKNISKQNFDDKNNFGIFKKNLKMTNTLSNLKELSPKKNEIDGLKLKLEKKEKEILQKLLLKTKNELEEKKIRKEKGKKELKEFLENLKNQKKKKNILIEKIQNENDNNFKENVWKNVQQNISFKISHYNHKNDLKVFKRVLNNVFEQEKN